MGFKSGLTSLLNLFVEMLPIILLASMALTSKGIEASNLVD